MPVRGGADDPLAALGRVELRHGDVFRRVQPGISAEPLLGPLDGLDLTGIDWLIAGGESGVGARPMDPEWARDLREQCTAAGVAFFFKQWGGRTPKAGGREADGRTWDDMPDAAGRALAAAR